MGNIKADWNGKASFEFLIPRGTSLFGKNSILEKSLVVHGSEDDLGTGGNIGSMNTGNAGRRLACGIIRNKEGKTRVKIFLTIRVLDIHTYHIQGVLA